MRTSIRHRGLVLRRILRVFASSAKSLLAIGFAGTTLLAAQSSPSTAPHHKPHRVARSAAAHPPAKAVQAAPAPAPAWPINDHPAPASIKWDSSGLRIAAANSSLREILADVATATGAKVQGLASDERVFGDYGPGPVRDVLSQLLQGSAYNILIIGDQSQNIPLQIVLSARRSGDQPAATSQSATPTEDDAADNDVDEQPQPMPVPPSIRPGFGAGAPARTPQQIMEEMQRQQQVQREQQIQQQSQPNQ